MKENANGSNAPDLRSERFKVSEHKIHISDKLGKNLLTAFNSSTLPASRTIFSDAPEDWIIARGELQHPSFADLEGTVQFSTNILPEEEMDSRLRVTVLSGTKKKPRVVLQVMGNSNRYYIHTPFLSPVQERSEESKLVYELLSKVIPPEEAFFTKFSNLSKEDMAILKKYAQLITIPQISEQVGLSYSQVSMRIQKLKLLFGVDEIYDLKTQYIKGVVMKRRHDPVVEKS